MLRGICVLLMVFGHLAWRKLEVHFHLGFVTVAEAFFFLSGATLGLVERRRWDRGAQAQPTRRVLWRGVWLYGANMIALAIARLLEGTRPFPGNYFDRYWKDTPEIERWLSLDQPSVLNVLPRYSVFLFCVPLALIFLRKRRYGSLALVTLGLWLSSFATDGRLLIPLLETPRAPYIAASWQVLFFVGMLFGWLARPHHAENGKNPFSVPIWGTAAVVLAAMIWIEARPELLALDPQWLARWTSRSMLGPLRVLNFAAAVVVIWQVASWGTHAVSRLVGWLVEPFGRWALAAFLLHTPMVWALLAIPALDHNELARKVIAVTAIFALLPILKIPAVQRALRP